MLDHIPEETLSELENESNSGTDTEEDSSVSNVSELEFDDGTMWELPSEPVNNNATVASAVESACSGLDQVCEPDCMFERLVLSDDASIALHSIQAMRVHRCAKSVVELRDLADVEVISSFFEELLTQDLDLLISIFKGELFTFDYEAKLPTISVCCSNPNLLICPSLSVYSNRMFLVNSECKWLEFFVHVATDDDFFSISSLPKSILDRIIPRAQIFDANIVIDTDLLSRRIVEALCATFNSQFLADVTDTSKILGLVLNFISILKSPNVWSVSAFVYNVLQHCQVSVALIANTTRYLERYIGSCMQWFVPHAQGGVSTLSDVGAIVLTIVSVIGIGKLPTNSSVLESIKVAGLLGRGLTGVMNCVEALSSFFINLLDWCYIKIFGLPRTSEIYGSLEKQVDSFLHEVNDLSKVDSSIDLREHNELRDRIRTVRTIGHDLSMQLKDMKIDLKGYSLFKSYLTRVEKLAEKADVHCIVGDGPRPEPVVVQFFGHTGCGKSHIPYFVAADLVASMGYSKDPVDYMYYRNVEQEFWDGYTPNKQIVVYDDFGQKKDSASVPNPEFMELIRSSNVAAWPLHMAHLSEKANTYFRSKAIILTSNEVNYAVDSLTHSDAYIRRVDLRYEVRVNDDFKDSFGSIDEGKVRKKFGDECSEDIYSFVPYIRVKEGIYDKFVPVQKMRDDGTYEDFLLSFDAMSDQVIAAFRKCQKHGESRLKAVDKRFQKRKIQYQAQIDLSSAEEFVCSFWCNGGDVATYYTITEELRDVMHSIAREDTTNIFRFIKEVLNRKVDLKFKKIVHDVKVDSVFDVLPHYPEVTISSEVSIIMENIKTKMSKMLESKWFKRIMILFGLVASTAAAMKVWKWFSNVETPFAEYFASGDQVTKANPRIKAEGFASGDEITRKRPVIRAELGLEPNVKVVDTKEASGPVVFTEAVSQAYIDSNAQEVISHILASNVYRIGGVNRQYSANICFVAGRIALCNWHVFDFLSQYEELYVRNPYQEKGFTCATNKLQVHRVCASDGMFKDAVLLVFPSFVSTHRYLVKQFVESKDISSFVSSKGIMVGVCTAAKGKLATRVEPLEEIRAKDSLSYSYENREHITTQLMMRNGYRYKSQSGVGDCGSVIVLNNSAIPRKICGIHVAGVAGGGYAVSITKEDLLRALKDVPFESRIGFQLPDTVDEAAVANCMPVGEFIPLGKNSVVGSCPSKTDIFPSVLYGKVSEPKCAPSVLRPIVVDGETIDPLVKGVEKCGGAQVSVNDDDLQMAYDDLKPVILQNAEPCHQRVLAYEEAIAGTNDYFMCPINRRSSAGYGWSDKTGGKIGKTKWLGEDEYDFSNKELREAVERREQLALQGIRAPHLWVDTLKVERRPIEKVNSGQTRVFSVGQMDYIILCRKYFLGFCAHIMHNRIDNEIAVGMNPYSYEWTYLAKRQKSMGGKCISADFKNFDGSLLKAILMKVLEMYIAFMKLNKENLGMPWDDFVRVVHVLFDEMVSSIHLLQDLVYLWTHSNPSGNPLTTIINCLYALILIRLCWIAIFLTILGFRENVKVIQYGDDQHLGISDKVADRFNQNTLVEVMARFGMVYTDENKLENPPPWRDISETTFLKRGFRYDNGKYDAPLCLDTCLEMVNWVRGTLDVDILTQTNVETACKELSLHGKDVFEKWASKLQEASYGVGLFPVIHSYENYRRMVFLEQVVGARAVMINHDGFTESDSE